MSNVENMVRDIKEYIFSHYVDVHESGIEKELQGKFMPEAVEYALIDLREA